MSLNTISMPARLVADLYQHSLIEGYAGNTVPPTPVPFLGSNNKRILVVVNKADAPFLPDGELAFLTTVLSACGLDLSAVAIVNWQGKADKNAAALLKQFQPRQIILFDIDPLEFSFPPVSLFSVKPSDSWQVAVAPSLTEIEKSRDTKRQLWEMLKQLFSL